MASAVTEPSLRRLYSYVALSRRRRRELHSWQSEALHFWHGRFRSNFWRRCWPYNDNFQGDGCEEKDRFFKQENKIGTKIGISKVTN